MRAGIMQHNLLGISNYLSPMSILYSHTLVLFCFEIRILSIKTDCMLFNIILYNYYSIYFNVRWLRYGQFDVER